MNIKREATERLWDDRIESWYITGNKNDYRIRAQYIGAYDENGEEVTGIGAEISIDETRTHDEDMLEEIKRALWEIYFERYDETIMICAPDVRTSLSVCLETSPDDTENVLKEILGTLAMMDI